MLQPSSPNTDPRTRNIRRGLIGAAMAGMAIFGATESHNVASGGADLVAGHANATADSIYTPEQLRNLPQKKVIIETGQGADDAILKTDPKVMESGTLTGEELTNELEDYVLKQGKAANHDLEAGQTVHVPIIAGDQETKHQ